MLIFQSYLKLRNKIRDKMTIGKDEPMLSALVKNAGKLLLISIVLCLVALAIFCVVKNFLVLGSIFALAVGGILYGCDGSKVYYDELFFTIGIPITLLNGFTAFIKFILYAKASQNGEPTSLIPVITALVFFLFGVLIIMTASSRDHTEITLEETTIEG